MFPTSPLSVSCKSNCLFFCSLLCLPTPSMFVSSPESFSVFSNRACVYRFSDASQCAFISLFLHLYVCMSVSSTVCVCACVRKHACEGGFISSCRWLQPLIHRSSKMKSPQKSEGREERKGQTNGEREKEGGNEEAHSDRVRGVMGKTAGGGKKMDIKRWKDIMTRVCLH